MKKENVRGLLALLVFAVFLSFFVSAVRYGMGDGFSPDLGRMLRVFGLILFMLAAAAVFFASKGHRLRMALLLVGAVAAGFLINLLDISARAKRMIAVAVVVLYLDGCIWYNSRGYRKALRQLNDAVLAYRKDGDGEKFLEALDRCAPAFPKGGVLKRPDVGKITYQEHIDCERIEVLGKMGCLEERKAIIDRLRVETKNEDLIRWLDKKEKEGLP